MRGQFLQQFFKTRGFTHVKSNHEIDVLCPFVHEKGQETRPSANVNIEKGVFHCFTCEAEGRFNKGGLSQTEFVAQYYGIGYSEAIKFLEMSSKDFNADDTHQKFIENLLGCDEKLQFLYERGITDKEIADYQLGYNGEAIVYPIYLNGAMLDRRKYNTSREGNEPKIKSEKGAKPLLFPYDDWLKQLDHSDFTVLTAGENDTILARKYGYNAVESTMGEGSFPKVFSHHFTGKKVIICYDCDEAGRKAAKTIGFLLKEARANVFIADLKLSGTKDDNDVTDFFIKNRYSKSDFDKILAEAVPFTQEDAQEIKNEIYPLVDLWEVPKGKYAKKRLSTRAIMMGKFSIPMEAPTAVQYRCENPIQDHETCMTCPLNNQEEQWWSLEEKNLDAVLDLVETNRDPQQKALRRMLRIPTKCPNPPRVSIRERQHVTKVILSPDVDTENELSGFRAAEQHAYVIGLDLEDGNRYRTYFKRYANPNDKQKIVMIVDRVEDSDNSVAVFKMTPEIKQELSQFQKRPEDVMNDRYSLAREVVGTFASPMVVNAVNIMFHSVLEFKIYGNYTKGYPEGVIIGESRTGKTKTAKRLEIFYGLGNFTTVKNATTAGLLGGADKLPSGEFRISWGKIPLNHKGLLILDEMSGLSKDVMATLTDMRSEGVANMEKIVKGKAPAKTRLLWISNPRTNSDGNSKSIEDYPNGVKVVLDLVGSDEDIARFDFCYILPTSKEYIAPKFDDEKEENILKLDNTPYHHLIQWAWSRKADQTKFDKNVDRYIWHTAQQLNEKYDTHIKFFGSEAAYKLARIAVSCAIMCFSHDGTGECILVKKEHVDWASQFLLACYDNETFRLSEFVENERKFTQTTEEINNEVAKLMKKYPMILKLLLEYDENSPYNLKAAGGISDDEYKYLISTMFLNGLINYTTKGYITSTKRLKRSLDILRNGHTKKETSGPMRNEPKSFSDKINLN